MEKLDLILGKNRKTTALAFESGRFGLLLGYNKQRPPQ